MRFRNYFAGAALAGCLFSMAGCGTVFGRPNNSFTAYPGVRQDFVMLGLRSDKATEVSGSTIFCYMVFICPPLALASIPIDAAIDTVLLPLDLFTQGQSYVDQG